MAFGGGSAAMAASSMPAIARCVRVESRVEPDPAWVASYAAGYDRFRALYPALKPLEDA